MFIMGDKMKNVSAIICSDIHLRDSSPICRTDDFIETQTRKLKWLSDLQEKYNVPILCGGDLFNYWKPSPWLLGYALRNLPNNIVVVPGQHDLPAHNLDNIDKSGIQVLADAGKIKLIVNPEKDYFTIGKHEVVGFPWGASWKMACDGPKIAIIHYGVYESKPHYPGAEVSGGSAKYVLNKLLDDYDLVISGDNHLSFTYTSGKRTLVNPGSFMRTSASQIDHQPSVYLWDEKTNLVERVYVPIEKGVISREHIEELQERDERLEAFVSQLKPTTELTVNFRKNLQSHISLNKVSKKVSDLIWGSLQ